MNFFHAFWSKPMMEGVFCEDHSNVVRTNLYCYATSAACVHKLGHTIDLYTDQAGADMLSFIPYDHVYILDIPEDESVLFAAQVKIRAYELAPLRDVYIDGDVFLLDDPVIDIVEHSTADVVVQSMEVWDMCLSYAYVHTRYLCGTLTFPNGCNTSNCPTYNTGLVRFNNEDVKRLYIANYHICKNILSIHNIPFEPGCGTWPDLLLEQQFLFQLSQQFGFRVEPALGQQQAYNDEAYEKNAVDRKYMHLGGFFKYEHTDSIRKLLMDIEPEMVNTVESRCKEI